MKKYQINLIQKKKQDFADTVIFFFLHYLRYIIVLTQIVVIGVFFFRFQVDQEIIDLKESIDQKAEIIKVTKPLIIEAKMVDGKIREIKKIIDNQQTFSRSTDYLFSIIPADIVLIKFEIDNKMFKLTGRSNSIASIQSLTKKIKTDGYFKRVTITELARAIDGFSFSVLLVKN